MNIGQNFQAYLTPLFIVLLLLFGFFAIYTMFSKKNRKVYKQIFEGKNLEKKKLAIRSLFLNVFARFVLLAFLIFGYFTAYAPNENIVKNIKESGRLQELKTTEGETKTIIELQEEGNKKKDTTGYLEKVGESSSDADAEAARKKYLNN